FCSATVNRGEFPSTAKRLEDLRPTGHLHGRHARRSEGDVLRLHSYARARHAPCAHADTGFRCPVQKNSLTKKRIPLQTCRVVLRQREHDFRCTVDHRALFKSHRLHRRPKLHLVARSSRTCRSFMSPTFGPSKTWRCCHRTPLSVVVTSPTA